MSTGYTSSTSEAPLSQPLYGASIGQAVSRFFKKYATFSGRASRSEFWWWVLVNAIVGTVLYVISLMGGAGATVDETTGQATLGAGFWVGIVLSGVWFLATVIPWLALSWRRFHDTNRSGAFYFLMLIPFVGSIIVLIMLAMPSDPAGARFDA